MHFIASTFCHVCSGVDYALFSCYLEQIYIKFGADSASKLTNIYAETAPSDGAIWDEFREQYSTKATKVLFLKPD